ncbi:MAG: divalent-cation tolerance protein CutA [Alphaproteobacteria bacterium]|nr:divalent-cation tolerance protein CutA [Alphaproteobacteria bacterium]MBV8413123.1 divalent-cation tolerance protein CutA [Alphaproteobacteria bacterium]
MKPIAVVTTLGSRAEAETLARTLVERRLAACAQISEITSLYRWKGAVQQEPELRLLLKTTDALYPAVEQAIRELHSYELPAIHAFALEHVFPAYAAWIEENVG